MHRFGWGKGSSRGSRDKAPKPARVRFFRNYNRALGEAYAVLLLGLAGFFAYQLHESFGQELTLIQGHVERHGQFLEFVLRASTDQIEALRMTAGDDGATGRGCAVGRREAMQGELRQAGGGFSRDAASDRDAGGNLVGQGALAGREAAFYCDLGAALALDGPLRSLTFSLPNATRTRFISAQGFHLESPWRPSAQMPFSPALYDDPVWTLAQPEADPDRLKFWAPMRFGGQDVGLLATVGAPVYAGERLMGVVAIDMSVDYFNRVNSAFGYPLGAVALIDGQGQVLAHPELFADPLAMREPGRFEDLFPASVVSDVGELAGLPSGVPLELGDLVVIRRTFVSAPWQLVYAVPREVLWDKLLRERGPSMAAVLLALAVLMGLTYWVTLREFVGPAAKLVAFVGSESSLQPGPAPKVPAAWRPWFDAVSRAFRESLQLGSLRKEVDIAARMQQSILPRQWPLDARFTLWGTMRPARDIGGDFYDHFPLAGGRCGLVVADVSGKGISAGLFAMVSKTLLRSVATQRQLSPAAVAHEVNDALCADNDTSMFVTTFYAHYDPAGGEVVYANAGHPPPLLVRASGAVQWLPATGGTAFGVMEGLDYREETVTLAPGDTLVIYTDGVTEAIDAAGEEFGKARLSALFEGRAAPSPREAVERVLQAVAGFAPEGEPFDDITCVALHCHRLEGAT